MQIILYVYMTYIKVNTLFSKNVCNTSLNKFIGWLIIIIINNENKIRTLRQNSTRVEIPIGV